MNAAPVPDEHQADATPQDLLALCGVTFHWPGDSLFSLDIDNFSLRADETLFLKGASGSGKSTLLSLICGIVPPVSGSICIDGIDIARLRASQIDRLRADKIGIIFQQFNLLPYGSMLRRARVSATGTAADEATRLLGRLGLDESLHTRSVTRLSIGQQQRVAVARAIIGNPRLVIADEPTSALDHDNRDEFLQLLFEEVSRAGASLIMVSHDDSLAARFDRKLEIDAIGKARGSTSA